MNDKDLQIFGMLKQQIAERMQQSYPGKNSAMAEWKGQDIVDFQEELLLAVNAHISEKWFYIHFKSENETLPRIDMLNLLSRYAGYANWDDFRFKNAAHSNAVIKTLGANRYFILVPLAAVIILGLLFVIFRFFSTREYKFSFYNADTAEPLSNSIIEVNVLRNAESPVSYLCRSDGSFVLKTGQASVRFVVQTPYFLTDTIVRVLDKFNRKETVKLRPDNYALMIQYFATGNIKDWQKRRQQLDKMISDSAMIYQVFNKQTTGVELFNKWEFINKLTLPSTGLKNIDIVDTKYENDRISLIRFRQKEAVR